MYKAGIRDGGVRVKKQAKFLANTAILTGGTLLLRFSNIWFRAYILGKIGTQGMGVYQLTFSIFALAIATCTSGASLSVTRMVAEGTWLSGLYPALSTVFPLRQFCRCRYLMGGFGLSRTAFFRPFQRASPAATRTGPSFYGDLRLPQRIFSGHSQQCYTSNRRTAGTVYHVGATVGSFLLLLPSVHSCLVPLLEKSPPVRSSFWPTVL